MMPTFQQVAPQAGQVIGQDQAATASRRRLAALLSEQGLQSGPVLTPLAGIGRLAQALTGAFLEKQGADKEDARRTEANRALSSALLRSQGAKPFVDPDDPSGRVLPGTSQQDVLIRSLAGNPDTAGFATQLQIEQLQSADESRRRLKQARAMIPIEAEGETARLEAREPFAVRADERQLARQTGAEGRAEEAAIRAESRNALRGLAAEERANAEARLRAKFKQGLNTEHERTKAIINLELEAAKAALSAGQPKDAEQLFKEETKLRGEFTKLSGEFLDVQSAFGRIQAAQPTPQGDIGMVISFMKMLDPGSVVREGEFATAQNTAGVPGRIRNAYNNMLRGTRLTDAQRAGFRDQAQALFDKELQTHNELIGEYKSLAQQYGLDAGRVLPDLVSQSAGESQFNSLDEAASDRPEGTIIQDDETGQKFIVQGGRAVPFGGQ